MIFHVVNHHFPEYMDVSYRHLHIMTLCRGVPDFPNMGSHYTYNEIFQDREYWWAEFNCSMHRLVISKKGKISSRYRPLYFQTIQRAKDALVSLFPGRTIQFVKKKNYNRKPDYDESAIFHVVRYNPNCYLFKIGEAVLYAWSGKQLYHVGPRFTVAQPGYISYNNAKDSIFQDMQMKHLHCAGVTNFIEEFEEHKKSYKTTKRRGKSWKDRVPGGRTAPPEVNKDIIPGVEVQIRSITFSGFVGGKPAGGGGGIINSEENP